MLMIIPKTLKILFFSDGIASVSVTFRMHHYSSSCDCCSLDFYCNFLCLPVYPSKKIDTGLTEVIFRGEYIQAMLIMVEHICSLGIKATCKGWECSLVVEHLPSMQKVLGSIPYPYTPHTHTPHLKQPPCHQIVTFSYFQEGFKMCSHHYLFLNCYVCIGGFSCRGGV